MHLHLNPLGGLAGDMFCAALLHANPALLSEAKKTVAAVSMPRPVDIELVPVPGAIRGMRFRVNPRGIEPEHCGHTAYRSIRTLLGESDLASGVRDRALAMFALLAEAEGRVHGVDPESVEFHEVGAWDSIADIVSAAALLDALGVSSASCAPLPLGGGRVNSAHGVLPVPAPAAALLLEGLPVHFDGIEGERVTPTGAAILRSLTPQTRFSDGLRIASSGMGFGTRQLAGVPNCLQILCLEIPSEPRAYEQDRVAQLRFEVDDQTPEDLALGLDHLRGMDGVRSVTTHQAIGKKGRAVMTVEILASPGRLNAVADACFRETTTIGLRHQEVCRFLLTRDQLDVSVGGRTLDVKAVRRPQGVSAKAESDDLASVAGWRERERLRRKAAGAVFERDGRGQEDDGDG